MAPALVPVDRAREYVPADVAVVPVLPGLTPGGLIGVTYEPGSTLAYSELVVMCALVRSGGRIGGWISHIWVDDEQSVSGGREIWKLPKELADFAVDRPPSGVQRFTATAEGKTLVRIAASPSRFSVPQPGLLPMISGEGSERGFTLGKGTFQGGPARVRVEIPADSPFAGLGMRQLPVALCGRAQLEMPAPK
jgi:hypothetical protein